MQQQKTNESDGNEKKAPRKSRIIHTQKPTATAPRNHLKRPHPSTDKEPSSKSSGTQSSHHETGKDDEETYDENDEEEEEEDEVTSHSDLDSEEMDSHAAAKHQTRWFTRECNRRAELFALLSDPQINLVSIDADQLMMLVFGSDYSAQDLKIILCGLITKLKNMQSEVEMPSTQLNSQFSQFPVDLPHMMNPFVGGFPEQKVVAQIVPEVDVTEAVKEKQKDTKRKERTKTPSSVHSKESAHSKESKDSKDLSHHSEEKMKYRNNQRRYQEREKRVTEVEAEESESL